MDAQTALWLLPTRLGDVWWIAAAIVALPAAFFLLVHRVINESLDANSLANALSVFSLFLIGMVWLNSGVMPWSIQASALTGGFRALLTFPRVKDWIDCRLRTIRDNLTWTVEKFHHKAYNLRKDAGD